MENNKNQFEQAAEEAPPVARKRRGRPPKVLDGLKVSSFRAALGGGESVSSAHLAKVTGLNKAEVMSLLKALIKEGNVVKTGAKKGSRYEATK